MRPAYEHLTHTREVNARKERHYQIPPPNLVKERGLTIVGILYCLEQVYNVVSFPEVVLYIIILGRDAQFDKLVLECAALLKEAMYLTSYFHSNKNSGRGNQ